MEKIFLQANVIKEEKTLTEVLDQWGIVYPHPSLGFFHFIFSPITTANKNGVRLSEDAVAKSINQLKMCQANINHKRMAGCGSIISAWVNTDNEIEIVVSFFKNLFEEEYAQAKQLESEGKLFVSFELCVPEGKAEKLADGTRLIHEIEWEGVGILMNTTPAYPNARLLESASAIVNNIFDKSQEIVFASLSPKDAVDKLEQTSKEIEDLIRAKKEDIEVDKQAKDALLAKFKEAVIQELGEAVKDWSDEQFEAELVKRAEAEDAMKVAKAAEEKAAKEIADKAEAERIEAEEKAQLEKLEAERANIEAEMKKLEAEIEADKAEADRIEAERIEAEKMTRKTVENKSVEIIEDTDNGTLEVVVTVMVEETVDGKVVMNEKETRNTVYTQAKMDQVVAEKDAVIASKDAEIAVWSAKLCEYQDKEKATKVSAIRAELGDFVKDLSDDQLFDETKIEIATLKKENAELKANKGIIVTAAVKKEGLEVGKVVGDSIDDVIAKKLARKEALRR